MMEKKRINWMSLLVGILFLILAFIMLMHPKTGMMAVIIFIAIVSIIEGATELLFKYRVHRYYAGIESRGITTVFGILLILVGIFILFNLSFSFHMLPYLFAVWMVIDSVENIFLLPFARLVSKGYYWFSMIAIALGIIVGIFLFLTPATSTLVFSLLLCLFFTWFGVQYIWEGLVIKY